MLIVIYGEDTYRSREWLQELAAKFKAKFDAQGYNVSRFDGTTPLGELRAAITAPPFLGTRRMVIVEELLQHAGKRDECEDMLSRIPESSIVILREEGDEKIFAKTPLFATLQRKKSTKSYAFPMLRGAALDAWVRERAKQLGVNFERGALPELVARVGANLWQLAGELEKLAAVGKPVTKAMVESLVRGETPENIFSFVDAISHRDTKRAIQELENERANGAAVPYLISMLARQFRMLREAADYRVRHPQATAGELADIFSWHPFVAKKIVAQLRGFDPSELAEIGDSIFEADRAVKSGLMDPDASLDLLANRLLRPLA